MRRQNCRGNSLVEFSFIAIWMVTLFLGTVGVGINLIRGLEVVQLARDAGHMFARGVDFSTRSPGNVKILATVGQSMGLNTTNPSASSAVLYLSKITYVDNPTCHLGGQPDNCANHGKWVFTQRQFTFGNTTIYSSIFGNPNSLPVGTDGLSIAPSVYVVNANAVCGRCSTLGITGAEALTGGVPSREFIYVSEAAVKGFSVGSVYSGAALRAYGVF